MGGGLEVGRLTVNQESVGSIPARPATKEKAMSLEYQEKTVRFVKYRDVEDLIASHWHRKNGVSIVAMEEWCNDSFHQFRLTGKMDVYDMVAVERFATGAGTDQYCLRSLLNQLVRDGCIEPGLYMIWVEW